MNRYKYTNGYSRPAFDFLFKGSTWQLVASVDNFPNKVKLGEKGAYGDEPVWYYDERSFIGENDLKTFYEPV